MINIIWYWINLNSEFYPYTLFIIYELLGNGSKSIDCINVLTPPLNPSETIVLSEHYCL